jgi:hypothetical protein
MRLVILTAVLTVVAALALASSQPAWADGCFVWHEGTDLVEPNQRAIISWDGKTETMILAVKYEGPAEDFAWLVPLPAKPDVKAIDADKNPFAEISLLTQVREKYGLKGSRGGGAEEPPVEVLERKVAGVYDIAILAAKDPAALAAWLKKNGYAFPDTHKDVLSHYTKKDWVYAAMRIDPKQLGTVEAGKLKTGELQPIRFAFASKEMVYPLKISSVNSGKTEVLLYLVADTPMVLASGPSAPGMEPEAIVPHHYFVREQYLDHKFMTLKTIDDKELPLTWEALGLGKDAARHLSKYKAVYGSDGMTDDLVFKPFDPLAYWKVRLVNPPRTDGTTAAYNIQMAKCFLAALPQTDDPVQQRLLTDEDPKVREALAENPGALPAQLQALASDRVDSVRQKLASNPALPADLQLRVAKDPYTYVRADLGRNRGATAEVLALLLEDKEFSVRYAVAENPNLPANLKSKLVENSEPKIRTYLAERQDTTPDVLARLAKDSSVEVRVAVARNAKTPVAVLEQLATDAEFTVRAPVAGRPEVPEAVRARLAADPNNVVRRYVTKTPLPQDVLRRLAGDDDSIVREEVGSNPATGPDTLRTLAADSNYQVRSAAASNPHLPDDLVATLAKDPEHMVRWGIARSAKATPALLATLAKDTDIAVLQAVAGNPKTGPETEALLAENSNEYIWKALATRPNASPALLRSIAKKYGQAGLYLVAANPKAPADLLEEAAKADIGCREAVANNPATPLDLLKTLAQDSNLNVARLAKDRLSERLKR